MDQQYINLYERATVHLSLKENIAVCEKYSDVCGYEPLLNPEKHLVFHWALALILYLIDKQIECIGYRNHYDISKELQEQFIQVLNQETTPEAIMGFILLVKGKVPHGVRRM